MMYTMWVRWGTIDAEEFCCRFVVEWWIQINKNKTSKWSEAVMSVGVRHHELQVKRRKVAQNLRNAKIQRRQLLWNSWKESNSRATEFEVHGAMWILVYWNWAWWKGSWGHWEEPLLCLLATNMFKGGNMSVSVVLIFIYLANKRFMCYEVVEREVLLLNVVKNRQWVRLSSLGSNCGGGGAWQNTIAQACVGLHHKYCTWFFFMRTSLKDNHCGGGGLHGC